MDEDAHRRSPWKVVVAQVAAGLGLVMIAHSDPLQNKKPASPGASSAGGGMARARTLTARSLALLLLPHSRHVARVSSRRRPKRTRQLGSGAVTVPHRGGARHVSRGASRAALGAAR